ncbi:MULTISPECIES: hypothetical protein [Streptomyces]|uniref:hypothetical protein n=1 Tax=Streptomyces TaxID=1883 RepID=UPI0012FEE7A8|nr:MULTISPECIES: hypothetical protein [Streptomyces]
MPRLLRARLQPVAHPAAVPAMHRTDGGGAPVKVSSLLGPAGGVLGSRFLLVSYLPTLSCGFFLLVLAWAGAPRAGAPDFGRAWDTIAQLGVGELLLLWLALTLVAIVAHPFQLRLVRVLEGDWPAILARIRVRAVRRQESRRQEAERRTASLSPSPAEMNRAGAAWTELTTRFPPNELPAAPTALGNTLAAMESYAGSTHRLDVVVAWPRLYPLVDGGAKESVDTYRDAMDAASRLAVTASLTAVAAAALLWHSGWWLLLAAAPAFLARLSYRAAVHSAAAYGAAVDAAIDTYRFALYDKLCLARPATPGAERDLNALLCTHWRQRVPLPADLPYTHSPAASEPTPESASRTDPAQNA